MSWYRMSGDIVAGWPIARVFPFDTSRFAAAFLRRAAGVQLLLIDITNDFNLIISLNRFWRSLLLSDWSVIRVLLILFLSARSVGQRFGGGLVMAQEVVVLHFVDRVEPPITELTAVLSHLWIKSLALEVCLQIVSNGFRPELLLR